MANFISKFASTKQDWETPSSLFEPLNREFQFTIDAAASPENAKVPRYFDKMADGLAQSWANERVWVNPPYGDKQSRLSDWVKKAHQETFNQALSVLLIPARTNTAWFHSFCLKHAEVRFIKGRPIFVGATEGLPQPLCIVIFRPINPFD